MKAFSALRLVTERTDGISAKDLAAAMAAPLPTTYHLLQTLTEAGALSKGKNGLYRLGPTIGQLADAYLDQGEPLEDLEGPLRDLAARTGETAYLSAWRRHEIQVIATAEGSHAVRVASLERGTTGHAHARASGKLLLANAREGLREMYLEQHPLVSVTPSTIVDRESFDAELEQIRQQGFAVDREEFAPGVSCVATPIIDSGRVVGAYTVSSPTPRFEQDYEALLEAALKACAAARPAKTTAR
jgi:DNA-binding IclR family transcriptional regulator